MRIGIKNLLAFSMPFLMPLFSTTNMKSHTKRVKKGIQILKWTRSMWLPVAPKKLLKNEAVSFPQPFEEEEKRERKK